MDDMKESQRKLKVIIVGASITGLTLAHCLERNGIDYVVLEAYKEIAPQVGASIGIFGNGARILDQVGCFDDIFALVEPLGRALTWTGNSKLLIDTDTPRLLYKRNGYPVAFLDRQLVLQVLYNHLPDKSKVLAGKRVTHSESVRSGAVVYCQDGTSFEGDIIAGCDGVNSVIRGSMRDHMEKLTPGISAKDKAGISAEYNCIYGIAGPVKGIEPGECHRSYFKDASNLVIGGKNGRVFFFHFTKLDRRRFGSDIPKYTKQDQEDHVKPYLKTPVTDKITFDAIWEQRVHSVLTPLEESQSEYWTWGRFVCLGDSIHKMTPNMGAGGNAAIESAAALTNSLAKIANQPPTLEAIQAALKDFQDSRRLRANAICDEANKLTRIEALATIPDMIMGLYLVPNLGDFIADITCDTIIGAETLQSEPMPIRASTCTMAWDPKSGLGHKDKKWKRALYALPLLGATYGCSQTMGSAIEKIVPLLSAASKLGEVVMENGKLASVVTKYYGVGWLDNLLSVLVAAFTPGIGGFDAAHRLQMIGFLADLLPLQSIWTIESIRRGNFLTASHLLPTVYGILYQLKGIGYVAPIFYFLHYVQSPVENYQAADNRLTQMSRAKTILPTVLTTYVLPSVTMFAAPGLATRQWVNGFFWQPFPLYSSLAHYLLSKYAVRDTTKTDRIDNPEADMPYLRLTYGVTASLSALAYLYIRLSKPSSLSMSDIFFAGTAKPSAAVAGLVTGMARALRYDQIFAFGAGAYWTLLSFGDLKKAKKCDAPWWKIGGAFASANLIGGPGAAMALMWGWREECLAKRVILGEKN